MSKKQNLSVYKIYRLQFSNQQRQKAAWNKIELVEDTHPRLIVKLARILFPTLGLSRV